MIPCKVCSKLFKKITCRTHCSSECRKVSKLETQKSWTLRNIDKKRKKTKEYNDTPERKKYMKNYRKQEGFQEREKGFKATYSKKNPNVERSGHLRRTFGISLQDFESMLEQQGGVCAICKEEETRIIRKSGIPKALSVDHCHTTGKIRGLLCFKCNSSIGKLKDSIELLQNAINYLKEHNGKA
jgi:hypothetical protein